MICLMPNCAYVSETSRMISIYKALRAAGAHAVVATHGGTHEKLLRSEDVPYEIVGPRWSEERCRRFVAEGPGIGPTDQSFYSADEMCTYVRAEAEFFRRKQVSAVVTGFTLTVLLSSRLAGIPVVAEHAGSYLPPLFERGLLPAASRSPLPIFDYMPRPLARWLQNKGAPRLKIHLRTFNEVARELGVEPIPSFPALLLGDLTLVTEAPEVLGVSEAEMRAWRPTGGAYRASTRLEYTGPIFAEFDLPVPDAVEAALNAAGPKVYLAITSSDPVLVRSAARDIASAGVRLIVAGTVHDLKDLENDRTVVAGVLPSHKIMPRVDLAVVAGGQGSVQCAMAAGTPLVGIPLQPEQDCNVHFVEQLGAARLLPMREVGSGRLTTLAKEMLGNPSHRKAAQGVAAAYAKRNGPKLSAEAILRLVSGDVRRAA
jgi:UDP:flavonoid glycosyltransferase YjiC (YdhE family)